MNIRTHLHTFARTHAHTHTRTHARTHARTQSHTLTHTTSPKGSVLASAPLPTSMRATSMRPCCSANYSGVAPSCARASSFAPREGSRGEMRGGLSLTFPISCLSNSESVPPGSVSSRTRIFRTVSCTLGQTFTQFK